MEPSRYAGAFAPGYLRSYDSIFSAVPPYPWVPPSTLADHGNDYNENKIRGTHTTSRGQRGIPPGGRLRQRALSERRNNERPSCYNRLVKNLNWKLNTFSTGCL